MLATVQGMTRAHQQANRRLALHNASWEEIITAVEQAMPDGCEPVLEAICGHISEMQANPVRPLAEGSEADDKTHGFTRWLSWLQLGWSSLPEKLPLRWLEAWRDSYRRCDTLDEN